MADDDLRAKVFKALGATDADMVAAEAEAILKKADLDDRIKKFLDAVERQGGDPVEALSGVLTFYMGLVEHTYEYLPPPIQALMAIAIAAAVSDHQNGA